MPSTIRRALCLIALAGLAAAGPAQGQAPDRVRAAIGQRGLWDTMVVPQGIEAGLFRKENLEVEVTWTRGGAETLQALVTGSVDVDLANGILGVIGAYAKGAPVRVISAQFTGAHDMFWYVRADSSVRSMKDMDGRTMGYSRPGSSTHLVSQSLAAAAGVRPRFVSAGGVPDTRTQVMSGQIDAGWSIPPFNLDLLGDGKIRLIARGSDVPALAAQTVRVNVASLKFLTERREVARRFMKAYHETVDWMYRNPDAAIAFFARFNAVSLDIARQTYETYPRQAMTPDRVLGLPQTLAQALEYKQLDKPMTEQQAQGLLDFVYKPGS